MQRKIKSGLIVTFDFKGIFCDSNLNICDVNKFDKCNVIVYLVQGFSLMKIDIF